MKNKSFRTEKKVATIAITTVLLLFFQNCGPSNFKSISHDGVDSTSHAASMASVTLAWDPNEEAQLAGYNIHYGTSPGIYNQMIDIGQPAAISGAVSYTVTNLTPGKTYYFVVKAYDSLHVESLSSNEVIKVIP